MENTSVTARSFGRHENKIVTLSRKRPKIPS